MEYCCTLKNERCTRWSALENLKTLCQLKEAGDICSLFMTVYVKCLEWASHRKQSSGCQCWGWGVRRWKGMVSAKGRKCSTFVTRLIGQVCEKKTHEMGISPDAGYAMWIINCYLKTHMGLCRLVHRGDLQIPAGGNRGEEQLPAERLLLKKRQQFLILACPIFVAFWSFWLSVRAAQTEMPFMFYYNG